MLDRVPTGIRIGSEQATSVNLTTDIYIYILYIYRDIYIYGSSSTSESENSLKLSAPKTQKPPSGARRGELGCQWGQAGQRTFETDQFLKRWLDGDP